ncbi:regulatory protein NosR [Zobellella denitrificans]|uniref:NosR/NirI family protein n=1 Tax=Zobellella denitrificans TaxID=347534 RepID=UPI000B8C6508|nr:NosR/NirI family protein [Zobellella denitrificans]OXS15673.1 regulatory protein NosR [Zobellella denitrificans]
MSRVLLLASLLLLVVLNGTANADPRADVPGLLADWYPQAAIEPIDAPLSGWRIIPGDKVPRYAFLSRQFADIPAYSGKPVELLLAMDGRGRLEHSLVVEHHEPILLIGIPEIKLTEFVDQYRGIDARERVQVGLSRRDDIHSVDGVTGATVTVMVINQTIMRALRGAQAALAEGEGPSTSESADAAATLNNQWQPRGWTSLNERQLIRSLRLTQGEVEQAFAGTRAASRTPPADPEQAFMELYFAPLGMADAGINLLGQQQYDRLMASLAPGDQPVLVVANGDYSFRGNGFVRGGIFDRIRLWQDAEEIAFRDMDYQRLAPSDLLAEDTPEFGELAIFIAREDSLDLTRPWQFELMVRRQVGALDSEFASFYADYQLPDAYLNLPSLMESAQVGWEEDEAPLWVSVWQHKAVQIAVLGVGLVVLVIILFLQDWLVQHPTLLHRLRIGYLCYTLFFIGWYSLAQLSIVNVFTFLHALFTGFQWSSFLLDPMMFILWSFVALTLLLWGRGIFCGWLCPFGALQELVNEAARKLKITQFTVPFALHERMWALKYLILLGLFGLSLQSLALAEQAAEVEPFKTAVTLRFMREWGYVAYALGWVVLSLFVRKAYCRYICPLGAALAVPARLRLFDWLKRRQECGTPCQLCAKECEVQAIHPDGRINANECHHCLDCQITYYNHRKCPPLVMKAKKRRQRELERDAARIKVTNVDTPGLQGESNEQA